MNKIVIHNNNYYIFISVLNINGNIVQIANAQPATTQPVAQSSSPTAQTIVQQAPSGLAMANGNLVMVRSQPDVRENTIT